jgi:TorA maturation chaperone TorD
VLEEGAPGPLASAVQELLAAVRTGVGDPGAEHDRIFGHSLRGLVCPYETEYGRLEVWQQAHELSQLAGFYGAFGLRIGVKERLDHIACEVEFLELLSLKEAWARDRGDDEQADVTRTATRSFLRDHLGRFGPAFARSLVSAAPHDFHGRVGALLAALLEHECTRLGVPLGSPLLEVRAFVEDPVPMACGTGGAEVPSAGPGLVRLGGVGARG